MTYFSLLYKTAQKEYDIKELAKKQPFLKSAAGRERKYEIIGSKMVLASDQIEKNPARIPAYFIDLNLDQIIDKIVLEDNDPIYSETFYGLLPEKEDIRYRQEIFRDLESENISLCLTKFQSSISQVFRFIEYSAESNHSIQAGKYRLDAMDLYFDSILRFIENTACNAASPGLIKLNSLLSEYAAGDTFQTLREKCRKLKEKIENIHYSLTILSDRILIHFEKNENDFSKKMKNTFFPDSEAENEFLFFRQVTLSDLELRIADILNKREKTLFTECSDFTADNSDFIDPLIFKIHRELKFYLSCHAYIHTLKSRDFSFCYPDITDEAQIEIKGLYDMAMAYRSKTVSDLITNDFLLKEGFTGAWVTGANQGGKTTYVRSIGQIVYFMLIGLPVPAHFASLPLFHGILTHFSQEENARTDNGKLKEELLHIKDMLTFSAGRKNFYILNELFSSTTSMDAFDMSRLLISRLSGNRSIILCVTHVPQLAAACRNMASLATDTGINEKCRRTYRIIPKEAEPTAYAADIAGKYHLTVKQIKEELGNES